MPAFSSHFFHISSLLLLERYNTWVPVYDISSLGGSEPNTFYARVSLQVYNDESDVHFLANAILDIVNQYEMK
jgi:selenocysteine lyase/cysteine desulfurase